jgi:hypothetical protein
MQHVHSYFCDNQRAILKEETYQDIMSAISSDWLPHRDYSHLIKFVKYQGYKNNVMKFFVPNKFNGWNTYVQFKEWDEQVADGNISAVEAARLLLWGGNLRLHCTCPAYHFWGMQYIQTQHDVAIVPEDRFPAIRNPKLLGFTCKHLTRTLKVLPFHLGDMSSAIKSQRSDQGVEYTPTAYSSN